MATEKDLVKWSKYLSLVLRHRPEVLGITLDAQGWTDVALLLERLHQNAIPIDQNKLAQIVATNSKKRFAFSDDGTKIRASQGHSVAVDLGYQPTMPPQVLYHGTGEKSLNSILKSGLQKGERHHVHLSADVKTAIKVGQRHGKPVVLHVAAQQMQEEGFLFFISQNGVWLTDYVPAAYLAVPAQ
jgi:putative RNA 2'-phosphotransferase